MWLNCCFILFVLFFKFVSFFCNDAAAWFVEVASLNDKIQEYWVQIEIVLELKQMWTIKIIRWYVQNGCGQCCSNTHTYQNQMSLRFSNADNLILISCLIWKIHFNANVCFVSNETKRWCTIIMNLPVRISARAHCMIESLHHTTSVTLQIYMYMNPNTLRTTSTTTDTFYPFVCVVSVCALHFDNNLICYNVSNKCYRIFRRQTDLLMWGWTLCHFLHILFMVNEAKANIYISTPFENFRIERIKDTENRDRRWENTHAQCYSN